MFTFSQMTHTKTLMPPTHVNIMCMSDLRECVSCVCFGLWFFMLDLRPSNCVSMCLVSVLTRIAVFL